MQRVSVSIRKCTWTLRQRNDKQKSKEIIELNKGISNINLSNNYDLSHIRIEAENCRGNEAPENMQMQLDGVMAVYRLSDTSNNICWMNYHSLHSCRMEIVVHRAAYSQCNWNIFITNWRRPPQKTTIEHFDHLSAYTSRGDTCGHH